MDLLTPSISALLRFNERVIDRATPPPVQGQMDPRLVPWSEELERHTDEIRAEFDALVAHRVPMPLLADVVATDPYDATAMANEGEGGWRSFVLYSTGHRIEANCERCPTTARLVSQIPRMTSAMFSVFAPHTFLPLHRAPNRGSLRYQLALTIPGPPGACRIRIGEEMVHWEEGKSLLFDHSVHHEAWNDSTSDRFVLFIEVVWPVAGVVGATNRATQKVFSLAAQGLPKRVEELEKALNP